jgi:hypothetical protein
MAIRKPRGVRRTLALALIGLGTVAACSEGPQPGDVENTAGTPGSVGQAGTVSGAGVAAGSDGANSAGNGGASGTDSGSGGAPSAGSGGVAGMMSGEAGMAGDMAVPDAGGPASPPPASCGDAARAYTVAVTPLDPSLVPDAPAQSWGGVAPRTPVAVDPSTGKVFVAFTRLEGSTRSVVIASDEGTPIVVPNATAGGVAVTNDGVAALLFDPNTSVDARTWASVARFTAGGAEVFKTDLFRSPNLDDVGSKGGPSSARLGYVPATDALVAYFGHTQRYNDGVRHQGGYLATVSAGGAQTVLSGWFGSHNLDQRLLIDGDRIAVLGLGDAFPKGIFFSYTERLRTNVIYRLAADGVGSTNGQLGGMVPFADDVIAPFITNRSIAQDLDAGPWPNTDMAISMQIRQAAAAGTDLGLLAVPRTMLPSGDLAPVWLDAAVASGARLGSLKAAQYGTSDLVLLGWAETTGERRNLSSRYYTMVVDREGAVCQPKTELPAAQAFMAGDDIVRRADGTIVWANVQAGRVQIVTLTP